MRVCAWGTRPQVSRVEQVLPVVSYILYKDQANLRPLRWAHQQLQPRQTVSPKSQVPPAPARRHRCICGYPQSCLCPAAEHGPCRMHNMHQQLQLKPPLHNRLQNTYCGHALHASHHGPGS